MPRPVVILDRDGTIIVDRGYLADPDQLAFCPGAEAGLQRLDELECRLVVVTNQSGIGRRFFEIDQLERVHAKLRSMLDTLGVRLEGIYFCPHRPEDGCACRKPGTGLMLQAAHDLGFDPAKAFVVGDKPSDVAFGKACGARTILISAARGESDADFIAADLVEAAAWIESFSQATP